MKYVNVRRFGAAATLAAVAGSAQAAAINLSSGVTQIQTDIADYLSQVAPAIVAACAIIIGIKYGKKFLKMI